MPEPKLSLDEAEARLTAPGAPFEIVEELVLGERMRVFKNRPRHLRQYLEESLRFGDKPLMLWDDGRRWTFAEHARDVAALAVALREKFGIGPGERVAVLGANSPEWIFAFWATTALGGITAAMNGWWQTDEIHYGLDLTQPSVLVVDERRLERLGRDPGMPVLVMERDIAPLLAANAGAELPAGPIDEDDPVAIMFTSGTTGRPKGAISTHRNLIAFVQMSTVSGAMRSMQHPPAQPAEPPAVASISSAPLFHVSGLQSAAISALAHGTTYLWTTGRFDPKKVLDLTVEHRIPRLGGITTQLWRILEHPDFEKYDLSHVVSTGGGGSVFSPELLRALREKVPTAASGMSVGYGSTECGGLCTMANAEILLEHPDSVGRALPTSDIAIFDDDGNRLPDGEVGNVCVRGPGVMPGYWNNPAATADAFFPGRWLKIGDYGYVRDGLLYLATRKRDMIIRGGENIYPIEIENRLDEHPDVLEAAVVGVDHRTLGQEVKAIVVPRPGARIDAEQLRQFVGETLAYYKVPAHIEVRDEPLPRNATGKVMKHVLLGEAENTFVEE